VDFNLALSVQRLAIEEAWSMEHGRWKHLHYSGCKNELLIADFTDMK
jgi:hypothetical protein